MNLRSINVFFILLLMLLITHCGKSSTNNKKLAQNYYHMSMTVLESDQISEDTYRLALADINQALEYDVQPHYLAHKATLLLLLNYEQESLHYFKRALEFESLSATVKTEILNNYACALAQCGKKDEARIAFERLEKDKNYLTPEVALVNQAKMDGDEGCYALALEKLNKALALSPDYLDAQFYLAIMHYKAQEYDLALAATEKTLSLAPMHRGAIELRSLLAGAKRI